MKKLALILPIVITLIIGFVFVSFYHSYNLPRNPPPPDIPAQYWDTMASQGFEDVNPRAEKTSTAPTFTISRGKTGVAVMVVVIPIDKERVWNVTFSVGDLPKGVTVTFNPAQFTLKPNQETRVNVTITVNSAAPTTTKGVSIEYTMSYQTLSGKYAAEETSMFTLIIT